MNSDNYGLCCGCLSSGRRMIHLDVQRIKQGFLQIISEFTELGEELSIWLCWECNAQVDRFTAFTKQIKFSYSLLKEFIKQQKPLSNLQPKCRLSSHKLHNINIQNIIGPETTETFIEVIKTENHRQESPEPIIKEEDDNNYMDTISDDEKLIDVSRKIDKVKKKKRKRKEIAIYKEIEMNREDLEEERRLCMLKEDYVNAMFRCEKCIVTFPNAEDLRDHISMKHERHASQYKCDICECSFSTEVSYNYHTNKHTKRYQCVVCSDTFNSKRGALKHFEQAHCHGHFRQPLLVPNQAQCLWYGYQITDYT